MSLILALMLVFSMSAALADTDTADSTNNPCTVKLLYESEDTRTPFVTWSFPSEIVINVTLTPSPSAELAEDYKLTITDAAIYDYQTLTAGFFVENGFYDGFVMQFENAPLTDAPLSLNKIILTKDNIDESLGTAGMSKSIGYTFNDNFVNENFTPTYTPHVIASEFTVTAKQTLNFGVLFTGNKN